MNRIKRIWILGLLLIGASCNSWLDVAPEDQIMEKDLFEEREGFLMALNGVYLNMNSSSNYGGNLSAGIIDVMAQYYNCTTVSTIIVVTSPMLMIVRRQKTGSKRYGRPLIPRFRI